jgi:hypothetical protein
MWRDPYGPAPIADRLLSGLVIAIGVVAGTRILGEILAPLLMPLVSVAVVVFLATAFLNRRRW